MFSGGIVERSEVEENKIDVLGMFNDPGCQLALDGFHVYVK